MNESAVKITLDTSDFKRVIQETLFDIKKLEERVATLEKQIQAQPQNYVGNQEVTTFCIGEETIQSIKKSILDDSPSHHCDA